MEARWKCCKCHESALSGWQIVCRSCGHKQCGQCDNSTRTSSERGQASAGKSSLNDKGDVASRIIHDQGASNKAGGESAGDKPGSGGSSQNQTRLTTQGGLKTSRIANDVKKALDLTFHDGFARFQIKWKLRQFIEQDYWGDNDLRHALTVTGSENGSDAWACSCQQYVETTWGDLGLWFLENLELVLENKPSRAGRPGMDPICLFGISSIHEEMQQKESIVTIYGSFDQALVFGQFLSWIAATFQPPSPGTLQISGLDIQARSLGFASELLIRTEPLIRLPLNIVTGSCWYPLLPRTVMGHGFPTPSRPAIGIGVQLSFDLMLDLTRVFYDVDLRERPGYQGGIFFRGLKSMLFPTAFLDEDTIQWHFVPDISAVGLSKHDTPDRISSYTWLPLRDLDKLRSATAILGYCRDSRVLLGTKERSKVYQNLEPSLSSRESGSFEGFLDVGLLQVNMMGFGSAQVSWRLRYRRGLVDAAKSLQDITYRELLMAAKDSIIIFETESRMQKAWLVPRLSVILDLINSWRQKYGTLRGPIRYAQSISDGAEASIQVLEDPKYYGLRVESPGIRTCVSDLVRRFYGQMQRREYLNATSERGGRGTFEFGHRRMVGWDLADIIDHSVLVHRRQLDFKVSASWMPLTNEVPVYFGRRIGNLITSGTPSSVCDLCQSNLTAGSLPNNILITNVRCLQALSRRSEQKDYFISNGLTWQLNGGSNFEPCGTVTGSCPKKFQVFEPQKPGFVTRLFKGLAEKVPSDSTASEDTAWVSSHSALSEDAMVAFRDPK